MLVGEDDAEWDAFCKDTGPKCYAGLKWIQVLYNANCKRKALDRSQRVRKRPRLECIEFSEFYNDAVNEHEEILKTEALQVLNKAKPVFGVCEMTFVLEPKNKAKLLQIESALSQRSEARATIFNQLFSVGSPVPRLEMVDFISLFIVESEPIKCGLQDALTERSHTQFIRAHRVFYATWQAALCTAGQTFSNLILSASL